MRYKRMPRRVCVGVFLYAENPTLGVGFEKA